MEKRASIRVPTKAALVVYVVTVLMGSDMIIACPACSTRYAVPDSAIGVDGRTVRCAKCRHSWFQENHEALPEPAFTDAGQAADHQTAQAHTVTAHAQNPSTSSAPQQTAPKPAIVVPRDTATDSEPVTSAIAPSNTQSPSPQSDQRTTSGYFNDSRSQQYADEGSSNFDFAPPFRPRRNWAKIGTYSAVVFAIAALGLAASIALGGLPDWVPVPRATFQQAQPNLKLDFPRGRQDRKPLPDGTEFFSVSGTITNIGAVSRPVPSLLVVLRDRRETIVYQKEVVPAKRQLAPGEAVNVNEALIDIPKAAAAAEIGWKPE